MPEKNNRAQSLLAALLGAGVAVLIDRFVIQQTSPSKRKSTPPHPHWKPPQPQPPPFKPKWHDIDSESLPGSVLYPLMITAVVPRPIALLSTTNSFGVGNLAPYSYFNVVAHDPPHVVIGCCTSKLRPHGKKDSLYNILDTGEFVVNIISEWFAEAANHCCGNFEYGENEMQLSGLTPLPSTKVQPPRVAESAVHLECKLVHTYEVKNSNRTDTTTTTTIVIGKVVMIHIAEDVSARSPSGKIIVDSEKLLPISRLGGNTYGRTREMFDLPRPDRTATGDGTGTGGTMIYTSSAT